MGQKTLDVFWGESPEDLLFRLEFRDFEIVSSPAEEGVNTRQPRIDRNSGDAPLSQGDDPLFDGLRGLQGTVENLEGLVVPCESLWRYVFDPPTFVDELRDSGFFEGLWVRKLLIQSARSSGG